MQYETMTPEQREKLTPYQEQILVRDWWRRMRSARPIPEDVRAAVLERASGHCEDCYQETRLELHHVTYHTWGPRGPNELIFGRETPEDLRALCRECHGAAHKNAAGEYEWDPEEAEGERERYLEQLAK